MFETNVVEKIKRFYAQLVFFENRAVNEITWKKYCRATEDTYNNMAQVHFMLDNDFTNEFRICNN